MTSAFFFLPDRLILTWRICAIGCAASSAALVARPRSARSVGTKCSANSIFRNERISVIRRCMRSACSCIMPRNIACASGSSFACPRRVSIYPKTEAMGVLSSWDALAKKSARCVFVRSISVTSAKIITARLMTSSPPRSEIMGAPDMRR